MTSPAQDVKAVIAEKVVEVALDPGTDLTIKEAKPVADAINQKLGPWILDLTNNEPWYQSKIIWGLIIAGAGTIARPIVGEIFTADQATQWAESLSTAGQFAGIGFALYARISTKKSIGGS